MKRNFERFEVGHYYLYTESSLPGFDYHNVSIVKENNIVKCVDTRFRTSAGFFGVDSQFPFNWENVFDNWIEVESPDTLMKVGDVVYAPKNKEHTIVVVWGGKKNGYEGYYILKRKEKKIDYSFYVKITDKEYPSFWYNIGEVHKVKSYSKSVYAVIESGSEEQNRFINIDDCIPITDLQAEKEMTSDKKVKSEVNKYKDGDVVYLRKDLKVGDYESYQHVNESMVRLGLICEKITLKCNDSGSYQYYADSSFGYYEYNDWMIEGLAFDIDSNTKQGNIEQEKVYIKKVDALHKNHLPTPGEMRDYPFHSKVVDEMSKHYVYSKMTQVKLENEDDFVPAKITF